MSVGDPLSTDERSERMSRVRGKNTGPELTVRRLISALGYRFRLHRRDLPDTPDLVFAGRRHVALSLRSPLLSRTSRVGLSA